MHKIFGSFLNRQKEEGMSLAEQSDLFSLEVLPSNGPPQKFVLSFHCATYVKQNGQIMKATPTSVVGVHFGDNYLQQASTYEVCTWLSPATIFHPNVAVLPVNAPGLICVGEQFLKPGTRLVELVHQLYAIVSYQKYATADALNKEAAQWARNNQALLPADRRSLKRRKLNLNIEVVEVKP